jgi:hypothetical protein
MRKPGRPSLTTRRWGWAGSPRRQATSLATTEQVPVLLLEPRTAMLVANPETGEVTEGQVEAIIRPGCNG